MSSLQRTVLAAMDRGPMSFHHVADLRFKEHAKARGGGKTDTLSMAMRAAFGKGPVKDELGFSAVYRMMKSLVHRNLVAELQGTRPRLWFKVRWEENQPKIIDPEGRLLFMGYLRKPARFMIGGALYELLPPRREGKGQHKRRRSREKT